MITFTRRKGRVGNRLFQLASMIGLAEKYGHELRLPKNETWDILKYFDIDIPDFSGKIHSSIVEPNYHYDPAFWDAHLSDHSKIIDICGWLQTDKYFGAKKLRFKHLYRKQILELYGFKNKSIAISVRRGDFVNNPNYYQLPITYYLGALFEHFPDWRDYDLVFFSDDPAYLKIHFQCLPNAYFPKLDPIDQLCLGSQCTHHIVSNSTFSWWMAHLSETPGKVIRPLKNVDGPLAKTHDEKDYWPVGWTTYEHEGKKVDLKDVTFTVPVSYDHPDRKQNLDLTVCMLQKVFDTNVILMEQGGGKFEYMKKWVKYLQFKGREFHRTKMLNQMAQEAQTPIIVNYDADVFIPPMQIIQAVHQIRNGADMVYPYDGRFARVPRVPNFQKLERLLDVGALTDKFPRQELFESVGGCVLFNRDSFIAGGMENENMISFGPEDWERYERFERLGYKVQRVAGYLFHMDHFVSTNSSSRNPHFKANHQELDKMRKMDATELRAYVTSWSWNHPYTEAYYKTIVDQAVKSRDVVFKLLKVLGIKMKSVIDIGCGCGEWGHSIEKFGVNVYRGVDHKVPEAKLLIDLAQYVDYDLTSGEPLSIKNTYDLALCLEVAEHLPENSAGGLIDLLTSVSNQVLFSAAIPGQGGVDHKNERWQSYWAALFEQRGFYPYPTDLRRWIFNSEAEVWYKTNIVLYVKRDKPVNIDYELDFVHPQLWSNIIKHYKKSA